MLAAGVGLLAYPPLNQLRYEGEVGSLERAFIELTRAHGGDEEAAGAAAAGADVDVEGLYRYLKEQNESLFEQGQNGLVDAWSYQQPAVDLSAWGIYDNCVGFVSIPSIGSTLPIYLGANDEQMARGAVHLTQTSYPVGGENTNSVIAAHRGTFGGLSMFRDIEGVHVGDEVLIENFREELRYRVSEIKVIRPTDVGEVLIQDGRDLVTLITCHPLGNNYQRYVVYCERT